MKPLRRFPGLCLYHFCVPGAAIWAQLIKQGCHFFFPLETKGLRLSKALGWIRWQVMRGKTGVVMRHDSLKGRAFGSITFKMKVGITGRCWDRKGKVSDQRPATQARQKQQWQRRPWSVWLWDKAGRQWRPMFSKGPPFWHPLMTPPDKTSSLPWARCQVSTHWQLMQKYAFEVSELVGSEMSEM